MTEISWKLCASIALVLYVMYDYRKKTYWKRRGIPQRPAIPIFSTFLRILKFMRKGLIDIAMEDAKTYGKVYGSSIMGHSALVVADTEMLKQILIKQSHLFIDRFSIGADTKPFRDGILNLKGEEWHRVRSILSPTFSSGKLKAMIPLLQETISTLRDVVGEDCDAGREVNMLERAGAFTMESSAKVMFAVDSQSQRDPNDAFVNHMKNALKSFTVSNPLFLLMALVPPIVPVLNYFGISLVPRSSTDFIYGAVRKAIQERIASGTNSQRHDLLALMIRAHEELDSPHKALTEEEMLAQAFILFLAGYETTANTIGMLMYFLAVHPHAQQRVYEEACQVLEHDSVSYEAAKKLHFLGHCLEETLRLHTQAPFLTRVANEDSEVCGIQIPKNTVIMIPAIAIQRNSENFEDPDSFKPERFEENLELTKSIAWLPFGAGPRNCIGMRLAQMEIKLAVAELFRNFHFELAENMPQKYEDIVFFPSPAKPAKAIFYKVTRR